MCGITGIVNRDGAAASRVVLGRMTDQVRHRGPDGEGYYVDGPVALGHRRLSVLDLTPAASQPMATKDARFVLTYNGEVYNFAELRSELQAAGCTFRSTGDTEVVLEALAAWGPSAVRRFNGMFALALWDRRDRRLTLARDRYGMKPLYWAMAGDALIFASEAKALLEHPDVPAELDRQALLEYLTFQNLFTERTLLRGVRLLAAGCTLSVTVGDSCEPVLDRFWDFCFEEPSLPEADGDYVEELARLFEQAVSRQLVSDVDVGSYLSGGMDSGSITAVAARQIPQLRTFTIGFDLHSASGLELAFDEREVAEHLSYLFRTEHYEMVLKAGDMERAMPRIAWHLDEPRVGQSYPNFYAAQLASKFGRVVLAGSGGDELFGGYPWRYYRAVVNDDFDQYVDKYFRFWQRLLPTETIPHVFAPIWSEVDHVSTRDILSGVFAAHADRLTRPEDYINHSLYFEAKTFLHGLLVMEDKLSMAHSLETRLPFLDNDLVDFAQTVPVGLKLGNLGEVTRLNENEPGPKTQRFYERTRDGKLVLRRAMARHIPDQVVNRAKQGFSAPDASWFRGESIDYVRRTLLGPRVALYDYLDRAAVETLVLDHLEGRENRRLLIWSLVSLEEWCRTFLS